MENKGALPEAVDRLCGDKITVLKANDGHEALRLLKSHRNEIKLAILDTLLPVIDGVGLCKALRRSAVWHQLPVALVGSSEVERAASLSAGCTEYLPKPLSNAKLSEVIDKSIRLVRAQQRCRAQEETLTVLVVDDTAEVRNVISRFLSDEKISVLEVDSGSTMDEMLARTLPDIIILDIMMPGEDGLSILRRLKNSEATSDIPVIIVSGLGEEEVISQALEGGGGGFPQPNRFRSQRLLARVKNCRDLLKLRRLEQRQKAHLENSVSSLEQQIRVQMENIQASQRGTIFALSKLAESRDPETGEHLERLQGYCIALCHALKGKGHYLDELSEDFIHNLAAASPLHDIGKVGIPDAVLLKPGKLTKEEFDIMKTHAEDRSPDTASRLPALRKQSPLGDGGSRSLSSTTRSGMVQGIRMDWPENVIPLSARILALGDVYDALTSARVYKAAFSHEKSRAIILEGRGSHFDPKIVDAFLEVEEKFRDIRLSFADPVPQPEMVTAS